MNKELLCRICSRYPADARPDYTRITQGLLRIGFRVAVLLTLDRNDVVSDDMGVELRDEFRDTVSRILPMLGYEECYGVANRWLRKRV